jgi:ubiquinone/menaquinone biosynthesis C-methylase UbiE
MTHTHHDSPDRISAAHERQREAFRTERDVIPSLIGQSDTIDAWRHRRMYESILPLVDEGQSWLTVGDSGADAYWLSTQGVMDIIASSITDEQLTKLQSRGLLNGVQTREINAENIDMDDDAVDFVLCKEAFHHFARPLVGFYEMLRVSRMGVVLLAEPYDDIRHRPLDAAKTLIKRALRRNTAMANHLFESSGNYIYGVSLKEIHKAAIALQLAGIYYLPLNDFFHHSISRDPMDRPLSRSITKIAIGAQDLMAKAGLMSWGSVTVVVLKQPLDEATIKGLEKAGFSTRAIPLNPYAMPCEESVA